MRRQLSDRHAKGLAVAVGAFALFGLITGLVPNPVFERMVPRAPLDYLFLALTAGLLGGYVVQRTDDVDDGSDEGAAMLGTVGGLFAFSCPICNAVLLALFSSAAIMTYFDPLRPLLGAASVAFFGGLLVYRSRQDCESCDGDRTVGRLDD